MLYLSKISVTAGVSDRKRIMAFFNAVDAVEPLKPTLAKTATDEAVSSIPKPRELATGPARFMPSINVARSTLAVDMTVVMISPICFISKSPLPVLNTWESVLIASVVGTNSSRVAAATFCEVCRISNISCWLLMPVLARDVEA